MPYRHCPSCRLSTFSAAAHSTRDECPRCGTELAAHPRPLFRPRGVSAEPMHASPEAPSQAA
jgi:ribosomal protein S27AE